MMVFRTLAIVLIAVMAAMAATNAAADSQLPNDVALSHEAVYNEGVRLYRDKQWIQAAECFRTASQSDSQQLAARARYNLGNCHYAEALARTQNGGGVDEAASLIRKAMAAYHSSLRLDPQDVDARANLELAVRALDELTEPEKKDPGQQPESEQNNSSQNPQQNNEDQSQSSGNQDTSKQQESSESESKDEQPSEAESKSESESESETATKSQQSSETDEAGGEQNKDGVTEQPDSTTDGKPSESPSDGPSQDTQNQTQPGKDTPGNEPSETKAEPDGTQGENKDSSGELEAVNEQQETSETQGAIATEQEHGDEGKLMTQQEAMKMLQAIRDRDLLRRFQRERSERSRYVPVDRDW